MSHSRKHLKTTVLTSLPLPSETERIVRVTELRGSNICEVELPSRERMLVQIPSRFRKFVWIKRGNYLIVNRPTNWDNLQYKVRSLVQHILFPDQIKNIKKEGLWPIEFQEVLPVSSNGGVSSVIQGKQRHEYDDEEFLTNPNHKVIEEESESEEEDGDSSEENEKDS